MDFSLSEEQRMLQDSVAKFIQNDYGYETRQKLVQSELGFSAENWKQFADLGWLCVPFSEEEGGIGGGPVEIMLLMEQFGKGLLVEPFVSTVVMAGGLLSKAATDEQKAIYVGGIIEGTQQIAFAYAEPQSRYYLNDVATKAEAKGDSFELTGRKCFVLNGGSATTLIVAARTSGSQQDHTGISLFLVDPKDSGVSLQTTKTLDGHRAAEIVLNQAKGELLGVLDQGYSVINAVAQETILALCSEAVGAMEKLYQDTVEYTKTRKQFGVPISVFQALQHRMVDMFTEQQQCKSLLLRAVLAYTSGDAEAERAISALKYQISLYGQKVAHEAVQIHGGMGMTDELNIGMYLKRINVINTLFGNGDFHLKRFVELSR